jgi:hypothetical protein
MGSRYGYQSPQMSSVVSYIYVCDLHGHHGANKHCSAPLSVFQTISLLIFYRFFSLLSFSLIDPRIALDSSPLSQLHSERLFLPVDPFSSPEAH